MYIYIAYIYMGFICKKKGGGGYNWDIKIFNATNRERSRREATLGVGV